jgi:hypothetical protein
MIFVPVVFLAVFAPIAQTNAFNQNQEPTVFTTTGANDFYFELEAGTTFTIRAIAQQYGIDSMFWLYNSNNTLLVENDDSQFGLDSYISYNVQETGTYRLRTGVCCGDPSRWYGTSYTVETNSSPTGVPPTTTTSTTTTSTTTTTIAPYLNSPQNLTVTSTNQNKVYLAWDAPEQSNAQVERYAVFFSNDNWASGWAISSTQTSAIVEDLTPNTEYQFRVRADNDSIPVYSGWSNEVSGSTLPVPTTTTSTTTSTTTTTTTTTTTSTIPETTTTSVFVFPTLPPVDTEEPVETPPSQSDTESDEPVTSVPQYAEEQEEPAEEAPVEPVAEAAVADIDTTEVSATELSSVVSDILSNIENAEELGSVVSAILDKPLTDEQFESVIDEVLSEPLSTEELSAVLEAVFDEPLSDEKFDSVIDAVLNQPLSEEQFAEVVSILESDNVTEEQVASAVDSVIENGVTEDQATELATSAKVLQSIDGEQATEIFATVDISAVTAEEAAQLVEAVQDAPTEVREALESEVNIFQGAIDTYVPLGSSVPIGTRRVIIGASALAIFSAPVPVSRRN